MASGAVQPIVSAALTSIDTDAPTKSPDSTAEPIAFSALAAVSEQLPEENESGSHNSLLAAWSDVKTPTPNFQVPLVVQEQLGSLQSTIYSVDALQGELFGAGGEQRTLATGVSEVPNLIPQGLPEHESLTFGENGQSIFGWVCRADGSIASNVSAIAEGEALPPAPGDGGGVVGGDDGNSDGSDNGAEPLEISWPTLEYSKFGGSADEFSPALQSTYITATTAGSFTANTTADDDLNVPGTNWVHTVDQSWTSPARWSFTETLVMGFNEFSEPFRKLCRASVWTA